MSDSTARNVGEGLQVGLGVGVGALEPVVEGGGAGAGGEDAGEAGDVGGQAAEVAGGGVGDAAGEVARQVPAVGDLDRGGGAVAGAL
jgi:hypothetical protein